MKRILFLSMVYPRSYDRTRGTFCYATCKALAQIGCEVRVVSPRAWMECLSCKDPGEERFVREVGPTEFPCFYYPPGVLQSTYGAWMWHSVKRSLLKTCKSFRPDAVISYWAHPDGAVAGRLGRQLGIPVGTIVGGSDVMLLPRHTRRREAVTNALRAADVVFTVSKDLKDRTVALGVDSGRVQVVYQGVDEAFCPGDRGAARLQVGLPLDREIVLWVGKMVPVKGLEILLEAFREVKASRPNALLVLVGHGPLRSAVERQIADLQLKDDVVLAGAQQQESLPNWYRAANVTVISSHSEGIPNVLRESLACGTPYVATQVGGIAELSNHPAVRLVPPGQPHQLATAILQSLDANDRILVGSAQGSWASYAEQMLEFLKAA